MEIAFATLEFQMETSRILILSFLLIPKVFCLDSDTANVCRDLEDTMLCSNAMAAGNCDEYPWSGKCRLTCGRCGECYDAENVLTCENQRSKGNCGDEEVAHVCSHTCMTFSCMQTATRSTLIAADEAKK